MKIDRLIGIVTLLLSRDQTTANELAARFEVSKRTILRDIDVLGRAGIPVCTTSGSGGGISIMPGYKLDKNVLTYDELERIITGLKSTESLWGNSSLENLIQKLTPDRDSVVSLTESMVIDLSSHYKGSLSKKIGMIQQAIRESKRISFDYFYSKGESERTIEPYIIAFKWTSWYVFGWCPQRQDFRMFKLNRLWNLNITEDTFVQRPVPPEKSIQSREFADELVMHVLFDPSVRYLLIDAYGPFCYTEKENGLLMELSYTSKEYTLSWVMSFGDKAEILDPPEIREEFAEQAKKLWNKYF